MEYTNLENIDSFIDLEVEDAKTVETPVTDLIDSDIPQIQKRESNENHLFKEGCGNEQYYGDPSKEGYFKKGNLFSELTDEYQRSIARFNLGIAEEYAMKWGNITGEIIDQADLYEYIRNQFREFADNYLDGIHNLIKDWEATVRVLLETKLDKYSPHIEGHPTVDTPDGDDNSNRIPSTEWVRNLIGDTGEYSLNSIEFSPDILYIGESTPVKLKWSFYEMPDEIRIDGLEVPVDSTEYDFGIINEQLKTKFSFRVGDIWYNRFLVLDVVKGIYYGKSGNIDLDTRTKNYSFSVDLFDNELLYLHIPDDENALIYCDNILGGFEHLDIVPKDGIVYHKYRTVNEGLGKLRIRYDNQQQTS